MAPRAEVICPRSHNQEVSPHSKGRMSIWENSGFLFLGPLGLQLQLHQLPSDSGFRSGTVFAGVQEIF